MAKPFKPAKDPRGAHVRVYWEVIDSNAWRCLTPSDQRVYVALLRQMTSTNNGDLSLPAKVAKSHGIKSETTLAKSLRALVSVGLIAITVKGGSTPDGQRRPTLYRVTDLQVYPVPKKHISASVPTNEWKHLTTLAMGTAVIKQAHTWAKTEAAAKKPHIKI